ncbi:MAG: 4-alpha-glucanotransferase [Pseudomonadota bacterium]|nr:4-alpha-glucanotransferase [Pseudomonadota bacterium]
MSDRTPLDQTCQYFGIAHEFRDIRGRRHTASLETKRALLTSMGVAAGSDTELREALEAHKMEAWNRLLPPVQVVWDTQTPIEVVITVPSPQIDKPMRWVLTAENGERLHGNFFPGTLYVIERKEVAGVSFIRLVLHLAARLVPGYHRVEIEGHRTAASMALIIAPERCYQPAAFEGGKRVWGLALQLYSVRSERNWGIGDFTDLDGVIELADGFGAGIIGLNPLHALFPHAPTHASPYSPSSRSFLNIFYLDIEAVPDFLECEAAQACVSAPRFQAQLRASRAADLVEYQGVAAAKLEILDRLYRHFREHHRDAGSQCGTAFRTYQTERGQALRMHALFDTLQESFNRQDRGIWGWPVWPTAYRDPNSEAVLGFADRNEARVEFFEYLQWQADVQLARAARRACERGLAIGIYQDLALGVERGGAETWANQRLYALEAGIGAPPDDFNLKGQDWGLAPLSPRRLHAAAHAPFVAALRASIRHAGALRLDHVMGLQRLFWIPAGAKPEDGAYIHYPFEELLGILALESQRHRCLVIGEDLGTVPDEVRAALQPAGILAYRVLYFEKSPEGGFKPPAEYPRQAAVAVNTHDLPSLSGYWRGRDLELRRELGLFPSDELKEEQATARAEDRARLLAALDQEGLLPVACSVQPPAMTPELACAVHIYLARTPAMVMIVQPEDILCQPEQANLPGTINEHPNWRRKLSLNLEDWASDPRFQTFAATLREARGPTRSAKPD